MANNVAKIKAAFFDVDGTLVKGFLICAFPAYLEKQGFFDSEANARIQELLKKYVGGEISYRQVAARIPVEYAKGIKGQEKKKISRLARSFIKDYRKNIFLHAKPLVELMNKNGFLTIAISGSPTEAIEGLSFLGIKKFYGTELSVSRGKYAGKIKSNLVIRENKRKLFLEITNNLNIDAKNSFAFGDTEQDLPMLEWVSHSFAVNPSKGLLEAAKKKDWQVCNCRSVVGKAKKALESI